MSDDKDGPILDMTPEGGFVEPPRPSLLTVLLRLALFGVFLALIWVAVWTAFLLLPFILIGGVLVWVLFRPRFYRF